MFAIDSTEQRAAVPPTLGVLEVYGRVPLFFFLLHIAVIQLLALIITSANRRRLERWIGEIPNGGLDGPPSRLWLRSERSLGYLDTRGRALLAGMQVVCGGEEQEPQPIAALFLEQSAAIFL
jgi:hypothetical protein